MKSFILISVLAALTVCNDAASIQNELAPGQEDVVLFQESGQVYQKDYYFEGAATRLLNDEDLILFHQESFILPAIPNTVQHRDVVYFGNTTTSISRIAVSNPPTVPGHTFVGNYRTHAHVRLTSKPGVVLHSTVTFFGRYSDWL